VDCDGIQVLAEGRQARFDPMITGFNPADRYAVDHIHRVLQTFPGVFTGIGEFAIHKEFASAKIPGEVASLQNPALDRILDFAAEVGLLVILHNDVYIPIAKDVAIDEPEIGRTLTCQAQVQIGYEPEMDEAQRRVNANEATRDSAFFESRLCVLNCNVHLTQVAYSKGTKYFGEGYISRTAVFLFRSRWLLPTTGNRGAVD
jgi:hypothetical protein